MVHRICTIKRLELVSSFEFSSLRIVGFQDNLVSVFVDYNFLFYFVGSGYGAKYVGVSSYSMPEAGYDIGCHVIQ